jgi:hypothetical protein
VISSDIINYNNPSLDIREFLSLGSEFPSLDNRLGLDSKLLSLDSIFSYNNKILVRLFCDLLGNFRKYY